MELVLSDARNDFLWRRVSPRPKIVCAAGGLAGVPSRLVDFLKRIGLPLHYIPTRGLAQVERRKEASFSLFVIALDKDFDNPPGVAQTPLPGPGCLQGECHDWNSNG
jgi:hypothetical protein